MRQFFWEQFINEGFDLTTKSRANFLWDEQILYYVGRQIGNEDIVLVTRDKQMRAAADRCGLSKSVMNYEEYLGFLGIADEIAKLKKNWLRDLIRRIKRAIKTLFK